MLWNHLDRHLFLCLDLGPCRGRGLAWRLVLVLMLSLLLQPGSVLAGLCLPNLQFLRRQRPCRLRRLG